MVFLGLVRFFIGAGGDTWSDGWMLTVYACMLGGIPANHVMCMIHGYPNFIDPRTCSFIDPCPPRFIDMYVQRSQCISWQGNLIESFYLAQVVRSRLGNSLAIAMGVAKTQSR